MSDPFPFSPATALSHCQLPRGRCPLAPSHLPAASLASMQPFLLTAARVLLLKVNQIMSLLLKILQWTVLSLGKIGAPVVCPRLYPPPPLVHARTNSQSHRLPFCSLASPTLSSTAGPLHKMFHCCDALPSLPHLAGLVS